MPSATYITLATGDPAPWFRQRSTSNPSYSFDTAAGRYVVLCFFGSAAHPAAEVALQAVQTNRALFDDKRASFFGVSIDPADAATERVRASRPGIRFFWDFDRRVSRQYGAVARETPDEGPLPPMRRVWFVLDPALRVLSVVPFAADGSDCARVFEIVNRLPDPRRGVSPAVPVLWLPHVFEPELCRALIGIYERQGSVDSGFMRDVGDKTTKIFDYAYKRRRDCMISEPAVLKLIQTRVQRRIATEILRVHFFDATRMERYLVACYDADEGAHFRAHRDNVTRGTAHRRYAVSINLNDDFEGGEIRFPEYGGKGFRPPPGGAVVFSCSMLHGVSPVTKGRRFAFLPFLYDDAAAKVRETNQHFLGDGYEYKA